MINMLAIVSFKTENNYKIRLYIIRGNQDLAVIQKENLPFKLYINPLLKAIQRRHCVF